MTTKCLLLHKELKKSQKMSSDYRSAFKEYKYHASENRDRIKDLKGRRVETTKQIQVIIDWDNSARTRIDELEKKRGDLI